MPSSQGLATTASAQQQRAPDFAKGTVASEKWPSDGSMLQPCVFPFVTMPIRFFSRWCEQGRSSLVGRFRALRAWTQRKNRSTTGLPPWGIGSGSGRPPEAKTAKHICCLQGRMTDHLTSWQTGWQTTTRFHGLNLFVPLKNQVVWWCVEST